MKKIWELQSISGGAGNFWVSVLLRNIMEIAGFGEDIDIVLVDRDRS
jgi:hypothetical protein